MCTLIPVVVIVIIIIIVSRTRAVTLHRYRSRSLAIVLTASNLRPRAIKDARAWKLLATRKSDVTSIALTKTQKIIYVNSFNSRGRRAGSKKRKHVNNGDARYIVLIQIREPSYESESKRERGRYETNLPQPSTQSGSSINDALKAPIVRVNIGRVSFVKAE